jgi:hypothetical protein
VKAKNNIKTSSLHDRTHQSQRARRSERKTSIYKNGKGTVASTRASAGGVWSVCMYGGKSRTVRLMMRVFVFIIARMEKNSRTTAPLPKRASVRRTSNCEFSLSAGVTYAHMLRRLPLPRSRGGRLVGVVVCGCV